MIYCDHCGAANDIMNEQCYRCGHQFPRTQEPLVPAASQPGGLALGQELELPDWLKRAAAETPAAPPTTPAGAQQLPPPGFHIAGTSGAPTTDDLFREEPPPPAKPLPPVPTAGLPNAMPDWLRSQSVTKPVTPEPDATDTSTFISENDLPEWIRQIAEADAAKKVESERLAAQAAQTVEPAAPKRVVLPGETPASVPAANPWLTRRDSSAAAASWGASPPPPAEPVGRAADPAELVAEAEAPVEEVAPATALIETKGRKFGVPALSAPSLPKSTRPKPSLPKAQLPKIALPSLKRDASAAGPAAGRNQNQRVILLAALILLLLILVFVVM